MWYGAGRAEEVAVSEITLWDVLRWEGQAKFAEDIPWEVQDKARELGYADGLQDVIKKYKAAARLRQMDGGVNINAESKQMFLEFAETQVGRSNVMFRHLPAIRALFAHNGASALAKQNANWPDEQEALNLEARKILEKVPPNSARDVTWWAVYCKVMVGLVENGSVPFKECDYLLILSQMTEHRAKDTAGRREWLARRYVGESRRDEAIEILTPVCADDYSAPNQRERAMVLLREIAPDRIEPDFTPTDPK